MKEYYRFRVALDEDKDEYGWVFSTQSSLEFQIPPFPDILNEKLALLRLVDRGSTVDGLGKRKLKNVFYVTFDEGEYQTLCKQVEELNV